MEAMEKLRNPLKMQLESIFLPSFIISHARAAVKKKAAFLTKTAFLFDFAKFYLRFLPFAAPLIVFSPKKDQPFLQ